MSVKERETARAREQEEEGGKREVWGGGDLEDFEGEMADSVTRERSWVHLHATEQRIAALERVWVQRGPLGQGRRTVRPFGRVEPSRGPPVLIPGRSSACPCRSLRAALGSTKRVVLVCEDGNPRWWRGLAEHALRAVGRVVQRLEPVEAYRGPAVFLVQ